MDYIVNAQIDESPMWVNKGNSFLTSRYGAALYIIALLLVVLLYNYGMDFSSLKASLSNTMISSSSYSTSNGRSAANKSSIIVVGIAGLLVLCGIILYFIRLYDYKNTRVIPVIKGVSDGKNMKVFDKILLPPSVNRPTGAEFAYSTWMKINDWTYNASQPKYILLKGKLSNTNNVINHAPSIQLTSTNTLRVTTQTYGSGLSSPLLTESVELHDIPLKKWFHLFVCISGRNVDIYINGILAKRAQLKGVVALNNDPLYVAPAVNNKGQYSLSGFGGLLYKLNYYAYYPSQDEIMRIVQDEPPTDELAAKCT
jgi:hypothetical protein